MNPTAIPFADVTWNPVTGCSFGCDYCYARNFVPTFYPHRLDEPLRRKKPARIFLGSMGDIFDDSFSDEFRDRVFTAVAATPQHTYLLLTKQAGEMAEYFSQRREITRIMSLMARDEDGYTKWPLPNLWLGVTVTNQLDAYERIPLLLNTPAAHRYVAFEPLTGPVEMNPSWLMHSGYDYPGAEKRIDYAYVGGLNPGKPLHEGGCEDELCADCPDYDEDCGLIALRSLRDQFEAAGVPWMYKHGSATPPLDGVVYDALPGEETP